MTSKDHNTRRRRFLKLAAFTPLATFGIPDELTAAPFYQAPLTASGELTILFQGDSITDGGRDRARYYPNQTEGMGHGYVYQIVAQLLAHHPEVQIKCYNRGISGNKVFQLADRWEDDCLQLKPQLLSLLIGVNDFWHTLSSNYQGTADTFKSDLKALLARTKEQLPEIKIILGEPFAVKGGTALTSAWDRDFPHYQRIVKEIAQEFNAVFIPYQEVFNAALEKAPVSFWCPDGVHPSMAGAALMKDAWLAAFHKLWP